MERGKASLFGEATNSLPHDRGYRSQAHPYIIARRTNDSLLDDRRPQRQDTGELDERKSNKRLRYTIPLRHKQKISKDEEKGFADEREFCTGHLSNLGIKREKSRGSSAYLQPELFEIVSTRWVPNDDGREIVTLTTKAGIAQGDQASVSCESRWAHITSETMTLNQFNDKVMQVPGLEDDDLALVTRLLKKVRKTCEKQFVHGRYLKPLTIVYDGEDPEGGLKAPKTATFVSLPIFTADSPRKDTSTREDEIHPVRALLQSRYRLESTKLRDREQVIGKSRLHNNRNHVVHVPEIWALIVNNNTIITCAPLESFYLRGDTIKLLSYAAALSDEATWSIQFTDAQGNVSYLPLRYVKSFFSLVKHISDDILHDKYNLVRDQLLKDGPLFKLVSKGDFAVTAESWPDMVEKKKTEMIQLRLVDNQGVSNRLLVTYCDPEGNEVGTPSVSSSECSSVFSSDDTESETSEASTADPANTGVVARAVKKLASLQAKLEEAVDQNDLKKTEGLRDKKLPALEERVLEVMAEGMGSGSRPRYGDHFLDQAGRRDALYQQSVGSPTSSPDSPSWSRSRSSSPSPQRDHDHARSARDLPLRRSDPVRRQRQSGLVQPQDRSASRSRLNRYDDSYDRLETSYRQLRSQPLLIGSPPLSRVPSRPARSRSHWDRVRSSVLNGQPTGHPNVQSNRVEDSIYYRPSDKRLARSRWDLVQSRVLSGEISGKSNAQAADNSPTNSSPHIKPKLATTAIDSSVGDQMFPVEPHSLVDDVLSRPTDGDTKTQGKRVTFGRKSQEIKPRLRRLIQKAQKETPTIPAEQNELAASETSPLRPLKIANDVPIFLWSTEHNLAETSGLPRAPASMSITQLANKLGLPIEEINQGISTSKAEELILHTITTDVHANLKKPKKVSSEYATLYERTTAKAFREVTDRMDDMKSRIRGSQGPTDRIDRERNRDALMATKRAIFDYAVLIMHAFVPEEYEAAVVSKYWGALSELLTGQDEEVLRFIASRLADMYDLLRSIQMGVRTNDESKQARYQIPRALPTAFQHIVLLLVVTSKVQDWSDYSWSQMQASFNDCESLLVEGRKQLILMIHTDDFRESAGFQAVDSEALLSLILANLVDHLATETDFHLTEVYSEYTTNIQSVVRDKASVKVYDDIKLLGEELDVIKMTLKQQQEVLRDFKRTMNLTYGVINLSVSVIDRMLESVEQRIDDFDELQIQAETARFLAQQSISLKAESNNSAIIVFTVVTIIFLPLSFVTSYLGMNTSDLRNMESGQTLFWAIGAPVAIVTFGVALVAAFYGTLTQRLTGRAWRGKDKAD